MSARHENDAWHRVPLLWLVIAIPSLTVAGSLFTIYLALSHPDPLVREPAGSVTAAEAAP